LKAGEGVVLVNRAIAHEILKANLSDGAKVAALVALLTEARSARTSPPAPAALCAQLSGTTQNCVHGIAQICVAGSSTQARVVMRQPVLLCRRARPDWSRKAEKGVCRTRIGTRRGRGPPQHAQ
jgi:hypothetical protein